jgi:hypothetical protein
MPIISRRVSLLMLSFAFFLLLAPALFSPAVLAQDAGGEYKNIWPMAIQWGIGGIMFTVWLYQFKKSKQGDEVVVSLLTAHLEASNKITSTAFEKYDKHIETLLQIQKDSQEQSSLLAGTLSRLEVKLSQPVMCPLLERRQLSRPEANNNG